MQLYYCTVESNNTKGKTQNTETRPIQFASLKILVLKLRIKTLKRGNFICEKIRFRIFYKVKCIVHILPVSDSLVSLNLCYVWSSLFFSLHFTLSIHFSLIILSFFSLYPSLCNLHLFNQLSTLIHVCLLLFSFFAFSFSLIPSLPHILTNFLPISFYISLSRSFDYYHTPDSSTISGKNVVLLNACNLLY